MNPTKSPTPSFDSWLQSFLPSYQAAEAAFGEAFWRAQTSGKKEDEELLIRKENEFRKLLQNPDDYRFLLSEEKQGAARDPLAARQVNILRREFEENQMDEKTMAALVSLRVRIESEYNNFRASIDGKPASDNEVREILRESDDNARVQAAWLACKEIGPRVAGDILQLVDLRNGVARRLGYPHHQEFALQLTELNSRDLFQLLDQIEEVTAEPFREIKDSLDRELSRRFKVDVRDLAPWHYGDPFFQSPPRRAGADLDPLYEGKDLVDLTCRFYDGIGLEIRDLLARSDLLERPGKCQHAFCMDIDRRGDVRVLCNLKSKEKWMGTMLHEFGHAVYDKNFEPAQPHLLRGPSHIFCTEAIAMLFGRMSQNRRFLAEIAGAGKIAGGGAGPAADAMARTAREELRQGQIIFMRWGLVMTHFERELYGNPRQDLDRLWWDLVERFQFLKRPKGRHAPDWATKVHIATSPVYYQNYMLGELTASQLQRHLVEEVLGKKGGDGGDLIGRKETGAFLIRSIFRPGRRLPWQDLIREATGKPLQPTHFIEDFARRQPA